MDLNEAREFLSHCQRSPASINPGELGIKWWRNGKAVGHAYITPLDATATVHGHRFTGTDARNLKYFGTPIPHPDSKEES